MQPVGPTTVPPSKHHHVSSGSSKMIILESFHPTFGSNEFKKMSLVRAAEVTTYTTLSSRILSLTDALDVPVGKNIAHCRSYI